MSELFFAKSFLSNIQVYPTKISPDYVEDPRKYPAHPNFNLPKHTQLQLKKCKLSPGNKSCLSVHLKSQRNPPIEHTLLAQAPTTSILEIKNTLSQTTHIPVEKIKLLHKKKPVPDSRVLKELVDVDLDENKDNAGTDNIIELSVMILGGVGALRQEKTEISENLGIRKRVLETSDEENPLKTEEFWSDLKEFLLQRFNNDSEGEKVLNKFRKAIENQT